MNRTIQKSHAKLGSSTFEYDITAGLTLGANKEVTTDLQGNVFEKVFDQNGRLSKVIDGADTASYEYADNGALLRLDYPGTIQQKFEYNPDLTLKKVSNTAGASVINTFDYTYDPCGNMLTKTDSKGTTKYTYDALSRLKTVTEPSGKNVEYEYDKAGNRVREVIEDKGTLTVKKYKYNPQNRLMEVVNVDMGTGKEESLKYIYDNNGNQLYTNMEHTQKADPAAKPSFGMYISGESYSGESAKVFFEANNVNEYNVFNQLIRTKSGDTIVTYKYNGEGQRIEKTTQKKGDKKTIRYVRLGNDIALEMDSRGKLLSRNISGTAAISREIDGQKYFLLYNGEGDVTALSDRNGNLVEKYYYDAFGNVLETVDASNQAIVPGKSKSTLKYRGYEYDEETKLYYLNSRMYDPAIARFLQEDTYRGQANDPLSLNLYTYCVNNPMIYDDPTGHWPKFIDNTFKTVKKVASETIKQAKTVVKEVTKKVVETVVKATTAVKTAAKEVVKETVKTVNKIATTAKQVTKTVVKTATTKVVGAVNKTQSAVNKVATVSKNIASNISKTTVAGTSALMNSPQMKMNTANCELTANQKMLYNSPHGGLIPDNATINASAKDVVANAPGTSTLNDLHSLATGYDELYDEELNLFDKGVAVIAVFTPITRGEVRAVTEGLDLASEIADDARTVEKITENAIEGGSTALNPSNINFSQRSVSGNVTNYIDDMKADNWDWSKSGPLNVMERDGQLVSYDNRRLLAAQEVGLESVPVNIVNATENMANKAITWEEAFLKRFNDPRNIKLGGLVPNTGLKEQPLIIIKNGGK